MRLFLARESSRARGMRRGPHLPTPRSGTCSPPRHAQMRRAGVPVAALNVYKSAGVIEVIDAGAGVVHVKATGVDRDLARRVELHMGAVHGPRRGPFEIHGFGIVTAAVARALELVLAGLPFRRATEMRAAGENDEQSVRLLDHPDAIGHQEALVHAQAEIGGIADGEN